MLVTNSVHDDQSCDGQSINPGLQDMTTIPKRDTATKVALFRKRFFGLDHVYGTYDPTSGRSWQVKAPVTDEVILAHLMGRRPYGVYLLVGDKTRAAVVDFDDFNPEWPLDFIARARHNGISAYLERSKSKGFHVWIFFCETGVNARKARLVVRQILDELSCADTEVFPKQDSLVRQGIDYGNFVNTPLFGALVPKGKTVFLHPTLQLTPYPDQWAVLETVQRVPESVLEEVIEINELDDARTEILMDCPSSLGRYEPSMLLPLCARRMLDEGVTSYQRVVCFRLAVLLRRAGIPFDLVVATLLAWSRKNRPENGKGLLTDVEVQAQTAAAFIKEYAGFGCDEPAIRPYCDPACPIYTRGLGGLSERDPK